MNCDQIQESMEAFLSGELSGKKSRAIRMHLASCSRCASRLNPADLMEVLPLLDETVAPSENFAAHFHARLQERRREQPIHWWGRISLHRHPWELAAAGAIAAVLVAGVFLGRYLGGTRNQPEYFSEIAIAENLPLLKDMAVIINLDLLEDLDTIETMIPGPEGSKIQRSNP